MVFHHMMFAVHHDVHHHVGCAGEEGKDIGIRVTKQAHFLKMQSDVNKRWERLDRVIAKEDRARVNSSRQTLRTRDDPTKSTISWADVPVDSDEQVNSREITDKKEKEHEKKHAKNGSTISSNSTQWADVSGDGELDPSISVRPDARKPLHKDVEEKEGLSIEQFLAREKLLPAKLSISTPKSHRESSQDVRVRSPKAQNQAKSATTATKAKKAPRRRASGRPRARGSLSMSFEDLMNLPLAVLPTIVVHGVRTKESKIEWFFQFRGSREMHLGRLTQPKQLAISERDKMPGWIDFCRSTSFLKILHKSPPDAFPECRQVCMSQLPRRVQERFPTHWELARELNKLSSKDLWNRFMTEQNKSTL